MIAVARWSRHTRYCRLICSFSAPSFFLLPLNRDSAVYQQSKSSRKTEKGRLTGCDLLVFQIDKFLESKDYDLRRVLWVDCIPYETAVSHTARNRSSRVPCHDHRSYLTERTVLHIFTLHPRLCFNVSQHSLEKPG